MTTDETARPRGCRWFEALFTRHHTAVRRFALRRVGDDADDVVAEVFTTAWLRRDHVPEDALPWLYRTALHHGMHHRRRSARTLRLAEVVGGRPETEPDLADAVASALDDRVLVDAAMLRMEPDDRELLRLWAWEQLDATTIGYVLEISSGAARVRLHRARRRLKAVLEDPVPRPGPAPAAASVRRSPTLRPAPALKELS